MFFGGGALDGVGAGAFDCRLCYGAAEAHWDLSARLMFL